jgi:hypothetical protein
VIFGEAKEAIIRSFGGENSFCCVVCTENLMESGEVLDLGELARQAETKRELMYSTTLSASTIRNGRHSTIGYLSPMQFESQTGLA